MPMIAPPQQSQPQVIQVATQEWLPVAERRPLTNQQKSQIAEGGRQWWSRSKAGFGAPIHQLLAHPGKLAFLKGTLFGGTGAAVGAGMGWLVAWRFLNEGSHLSRTQTTLIGGAALGLLAGVRGAVSGYFNQRRSNEDIVDLMERGGTTYRDALSDPVFQQQKTQRAADRSARNRAYVMIAIRLIPELLRLFLSSKGSGSSSSSSSSSDRWTSADDRAYEQAFRDYKSSASGGSNDTSS